MLYKVESCGWVSMPAQALIIVINADKFEKLYRNLGCPYMRYINCPYSKIHGINLGPTWVLSAPDGPRVGPMNLAIGVNYARGLYFTVFCCGSAPVHYNHIRLSYKNVYLSSTGAILTKMGKWMITKIDKITKTKQNTEHVVIFGGVYCTLGHSSETLTNTNASWQRRQHNYHIFMVWCGV